MFLGDHGDVVARRDYAPVLVAEADTLEYQ